MQNSNIPSRKAKKKRRVWPWVLLFFCFAAAAIGGALFASSSLLDKPVEKAIDDGLLTAKDKSTIMIMGIDERDDDVGRSDTLMIASLDPKKNQASLLSVPRDTRVKIKGHGFDKINAAYAYGHEQLSQNTVENLLGVNIDHYIIINSKSFKKIIDAIGGIDIIDTATISGYPYPSFCILCDAIYIIMAQAEGVFPIVFEIYHTKSGMNIFSG